MQLRSELIREWLSIPGSAFLFTHRNPVYLVLLIQRFNKSVAIGDYSVRGTKLNFTAVRTGTATPSWYTGSNFHDSTASSAASVNSFEE